jgi:hypothetical protein
MASSPGTTDRRIDTTRSCFRSLWTVAYINPGVGCRRGATGGGPGPRGPSGAGSAALSRDPERESVITRRAWRVGSAFIPAARDGGKYCAAADPQRLRGDVASPANPSEAAERELHEAMNLPVRRIFHPPVELAEIMQARLGYDAPPYPQRVTESSEQHCRVILG